MPTERGWLVLGSGAALVALWVLLGEIELLLAGIVALVAIAAAIVLTRGAPPQIGIVRQLHPSLVHEGDRATVDAFVTNIGGRTLRNATLTDQVSRLGAATFQVGTLRPGVSGDAQYQILCRPRGVYPVGPVVVEVADPFRLATVSAEVDSVDRLIVYPQIEPLSGFPVTRGKDPAMQASRPEYTQRGGEDFYTLREYVRGDDLRRVHWPSSAKRDDLMIRQMETPWQSRALVLLDLRNRVYESDDGFEKAVRGAASIVRHLAKTGFDADLWAGGGQTVPVDQYAAVMERLAIAERDPGLDIKAVASRLKHSGRGGALVLVTGTPDHELLEAHRLLARDYRTTVLMAATTHHSPSYAAFQRTGAVTLMAAPDTTWTSVWSKEVSRAWLDASAG